MTGQPQDHDDRTGAELLREAARLMRARADDAVLATGDGAWRFDNLGWNDDIGTTYEVVAPDARVCSALTEEQAYHVAGWHPAVALAVADWLDEVAHAWDIQGRTAPFPVCAIDVARAYLAAPVSAGEPGGRDGV